MRTIMSILGFMILVFAVIGVVVVVSESYKCIRKHLLKIRLLDINQDVESDRIDLIHKEIRGQKADIDIIYAGVKIAEERLKKVEHIADNFDRDMNKYHKTNQVIILEYEKKINDRLTKLEDLDAKVENSFKVVDNLDRAVNSYIKQADRNYKEFHKLKLELKK